MKKMILMCIAAPAMLYACNKPAEDLELKTLKALKGTWERKAIVSLIQDDRKIQFLNDTQVVHWQKSMYAQWKKDGDTATYIIKNGTEIHLKDKLFTTFGGNPLVITKLNGTKFIYDAYDTDASGKKYVVTTLSLTKLN
jgi:hypothetical protein